MPHTIICLLLEVSLAWFYKWRDRALVVPAVARGLHVLGIDAVHQPGWREDETKRVIFHADRGATYTANSFTKLCRQFGIRQSMGTGGAVLRQRRLGGVHQQREKRREREESPEQEVLSRHEFENTRQAQAVVLDRHYRSYNHKRRHSTIDVMSPSNYENTTTSDQETAHRKPSTI